MCEQKHCEIMIYKRKISQKNCFYPLRQTAKWLGYSVHFAASVLVSPTAICISWLFLRALPVCSSITNISRAQTDALHVRTPRKNERKSEMVKSEIIILEPPSQDSTHPHWLLCIWGLAGKEWRGALWWVWGITLNKLRETRDSKPLSTENSSLWWAGVWLQERSMWEPHDDSSIICKDLRNDNHKLIWGFLLRTMGSFGRIFQQRNWRLEWGQEYVFWWQFSMVLWETNVGA